MTVSLILLNYNDYKTTINYLKMVEDYEKIDNIVVVDNCSTDNSYEEIKKYESKKIVVLKSEKNGGYATGNNIGIRYAKEKYNPEYYIVSNADVIFEEYVVEKMIVELENDEKKAMVAPLVISPNGLDENKGWRIPTYWANICSLSLVLHKLFYSNRHYSLEYFKNGISDVDVILGSFFMIKASVFYEIGLFDEGTFLYCEENIIGFKLKLLGYKSSILNECNYIHNHSTTIVRELSSEAIRFRILYESLSYYNDKYLKIGIVKKIIYKILFRVFTLEKLFASKFRNRKNRKTS